jgi:hypothetical protein
MQPENQAASDLAARTCPGQRAVLHWSTHSMVMLHG